MSKKKVRAGNDIRAIYNTMSDWDFERLVAIKKRHALEDVPSSVLNKVNLLVEGCDLILTRKKGYVLSEEESKIVESFNERINEVHINAAPIEEFLARKYGK